MQISESYVSKEYKDFGVVYMFFLFECLRYYIFKVCTIHDEVLKVSFCNRLCVCVLLSVNSI